MGTAHSYLPYTTHHQAPRSGARKPASDLADLQRPPALPHAGSSIGRQRQRLWTPDSSQARPQTRPPLLA